MKTAAEFIEFFEAIPEEKWCTRSFANGDKCCAHGHLGSSNDQFSTDSKNLHELFIAHFRGQLGPMSVNDGSDNAKQFPQPTPKQRILAALREIQAKELQP